MNRVSILKSERANLPEMEAYQSILQSTFEVRLVDEITDDLRNDIVWCFMGLYRSPIKCRYLIHDYRSLSTGRGMVLKDWLKRTFNIKPNLRIFLNEEVESIMNFKDNIPSCCLDMGIPESISDYRHLKRSSYPYCFCYIGAMSHERKSHLMLDHFIDSEYGNKSFLCVGDPDPWIRNRYEKNKNIIFTGKVPQEAVFDYLTQSQYSICHFPYHRPHCYQTPTKMLEYASLGNKIIANNSPSNLRTSEEYSLNVIWGGKHVFDHLKLDQITESDNAKFDPSSIFWDKRFQSSGVWKYLDSLK